MENIETSLIGKYIKSLRLSRGWSQAELERITDLSASFISKIERGNNGLFYNMSLPALAKITRAFKMTINDLLKNSGYLAAIGDEKFAAGKVNIYIENHELINLFNRLNLKQQKAYIDLLYTLVEENDKINQHKLNKKKP